MDIINRLHTTFKDCQYFEFGEDFVKFLDKDNGKTYLISIEEVNMPKKSILKGVQSNELQKTIRSKGKEKRKTWESILKEKGE
jgi:hypothetical protein